MAKEKKEEELYSVLNITRQMVLDNLALAEIGYYCDKPYYIIRCIEILLSDVDELREDMLEKYPELYKFLEIRKAIAASVKTYYDGLEGKEIAKKDISSERFVEFDKGMLDLAIIDKELLKIFFDVVKRTELVDYSIPSESYARAERKYKVFEPQEEIMAREMAESQEEE